MPETAPSCPLCGAPAPRTAYRARLAFPDEPGRPLDLRRCGGCGVLFAHPMPAAERLAALYQDPAYFEGEVVSGQYEGGYEGGGERYRRRALRLDARLAPDGRRGRLLEVGAAGGLWLAAMRELGWEVQGVEVSASLRARALERHGLVLHADLDALPAGMRFEAIYMAQTLEHFSDPHVPLARLAGRLDPGGRLALEVPATLNTPLFRLLQALRLALGPCLTRWDGPLERLRLLGAGRTLPPYHVYEYHPRSLRRLLARHGLRVLRMSREVPRPDRFYRSAGRDPARLLMRGAFGALDLAARGGLGLAGDLHVVAGRDPAILPP